MAALSSTASTGQPSPATQPQPTEQLSIYDAFLEIFDPSSVEGTTIPSLCGRIGEFFDAIGRAIANLFYSIFPPPPPGFISADLITQQHLGWGQACRVDVLEQRSTEYKNQLIRLFNPNPHFTNWLKRIHDSELRDSDIDETIQRAIDTLRDDGNDAAAVAHFEETLQIDVNEFRYVRLVKYLNDDERVVMQEQPSSYDGNCFLASCSHGLKRITTRKETTGPMQLKRRMTEQFDRAISERSPEAKEFREQMINNFVGNVSIAGRVIPDNANRAPWERALFDRYSDEEIINMDAATLQDAIRELPDEVFAIGGIFTEQDLNEFKERLSNPQVKDQQYFPREKAVLHYFYRQKCGEMKSRKLSAEDQSAVKTALCNDLVAQVAHAMEQLTEQSKRRVLSQVETAAEKLKDDVTKRYLNQFHAEPRPYRDGEPRPPDITWELDLFTEYGKENVLDRANDQLLLDAMKAKGVQGDDATLIRKRELFRARVGHICDTYRNALARDGAWNGALEAILAARVLQRPIVILERHNNDHWRYQTLLGKEFLRPLDKLHEKPPITVLHAGNHYTTGYYPTPAPKPVPV